MKAIRKTATARYRRSLKLLAPWRVMDPGAGAGMVYRENCQPKQRWTGRPEEAARKNHPASATAHGDRRLKFEINDSDDDEPLDFEAAAGGAA